PGRARLAPAALPLRLAAADGGAQTTYNRGRNVTPAFEGWLETADGTRSFVFGYMNQNWEEELDVPVGPDNTIEPGGPDLGQPTHFQPRRNRFVFMVPVPKSFKETDELLWKLTTPESGELMEALRREITATWQTEEIRPERPTPVDEVIGGLLIFEQTLWDALARYLRTMDGALSRPTGRGLPLDAAPIRFGSW